MSSPIPQNPILLKSPGRRIEGSSPVPEIREVEITSEDLVTREMELSTSFLNIQWDPVAGAIQGWKVGDSVELVVKPKKLAVDDKQ